jgi:hypothetical protein
MVHILEEGLVATMTDPVDTDALRESSIWVRTGLRWWLKHHGDPAINDHVVGLGGDLAAAADEVDRLRAELGTQARVNKNLKRAADAFLDEGNRLRAVIENAPHDSITCKWWWSRNTVEPMSCTCWKADV